jgi:hypothetical protein
MTFKELADEIYKLPDIQQAQLAIVWPPSVCPSDAGTKVVGLIVNSVGKPIISTGKVPSA